jgi:hypothetical protein
MSIKASFVKGAAKAAIPRSVATALKSAKDES